MSILRVISVDHNFTEHGKKSVLNKNNAITTMNEVASQILQNIDVLFFGF